MVAGHSRGLREPYPSRELLLFSRSHAYRNGSLPPAVGHGDKTRVIKIYARPHAPYFSLPRGQILRRDFW